jgi:hypothetical protein
MPAALSKKRVNVHLVAGPDRPLNPRYSGVFKQGTDSGEIGGSIFSDFMINHIAWPLRL